MIHYRIRRQLALSNRHWIIEVRGLFRWHKLNGLEYSSSECALKDLADITHGEGCIIKVDTKY